MFKLGDGNHRAKTYTYHSEFTDATKPRSAAFKASTNLLDRRLVDHSLPSKKN